MPAQKLNMIADDPDDNKIIECAVAAGAAVIVSSDKHLLRLGQYRGIRIMQVRQLLESI
jgi:uncharacterized protein